MIVRFLYAVVILSALHLTSCTSSRPLTSSSISKAAESVVQILVDGEVRGTGFIVTSEGHVLTCYHVAYVSLLFDRDRPTTALGERTITIKTSDGNIHDVAYDRNQFGKKDNSDRDYFIMKIVGGNSFSEVDFGSYQDLELGMTVFTIGFPLGIDQAAYRKGYVSSLYNQPLTDGGLATNTGWIDMNVAQGHSGGPVYYQDDAGRIKVAGYLVLALTPARDQIKELSDRVTLPPRLSKEFDKQFVEGSIAYLHHHSRQVGSGLAGFISLEYVEELIRAYKLD